MHAFVSQYTRIHYDKELLYESARMNVEINLRMNI